MAKGQHRTAVSDGRRGVQLEQQTTFDDSLLPPAEELSRLKEVNPSIIQWIMERTEKEQEARIKFNNERMRLVHRDMNTTQMSLWLAFTLAIAILGLGGLFIALGKEVTGTILSGVGVFVVVQSFLKFGRKQNQ